MTRTTQLLVVLLLGCTSSTSPRPERQAEARAGEEGPSPASPDRAHKADGTALHARTSPAVAAAGEPAPDDDVVAPATATLPDWSADERVQARLRGPKGAPPKHLDTTSLVAEADLRVDLLRSMGDDAEPDQEPEGRHYRVYLMVGRAKQAHLVELARQDRTPGYAPLGPPKPPVIAETRWSGAGSEGPDLALTVSTASLWGTQCRDGQDERRDLILCDVEAERLRCARAPLDLTYYDGCGGAEAYDDGPDLEERCARVSFTSSWRTEAETLEITTRDAVDVDCLDAEADGSIGEPRPPLPSPLDYATLLDAHALEVTTLAAP